MKRRTVALRKTVTHETARVLRTIDASIRQLEQEHAELFASAFAQLVALAKNNGVDVVADADSIAVRFIPSGQIVASTDLRQLGEIVRVHNACGSGGSRRNPGGGEA